MSTTNCSTENNNKQDSSDDDELFGEELDFFDFLQAITTRIDKITNENQESLKRAPDQWQRITNDLKLQRRRLKSRLEQRINGWSKNLKQPNFIRTRDKIAFSIGVANTCCSPLIASQWPHIMPFVYAIQVMFFIPLRFFSYKRKNWHYSVFDLCYFVNLLTLLYLWVFPSSKMLLTVCYMLSHGPLIFAIVLWRNSLVFHSLDKVTNVFIHIYPALTLFTLRWLLPVELQHKWYPAILYIGSSLTTLTSLYYTIAYYLFWQFLYYVFIVYGRREKVSQGLRATSYTWLLSDKTGLVSRLIGIFIKDTSERSTDQLKVIAYFVLQFCYMFLSVLPVCWLYYSYMYVNIGFLWTVFIISVYNGASFYIDVFSRRYIESLELLQECDDHNDKEH